MFAAVAVYFNPADSKRLRDNWLRFVGQRWDCPLFTLAAQFPGQAPVPATWTVPADERHIVWQKESLVNSAVRRLPAEFDRVAWIDGDLTLLNPHWSAETEAVLETSAVAQLCSRFQFTDALGRVVRTNPSMLFKAADATVPRLEHASPGGCWAARRDVLDRIGGLYAHNIVGGGDHHFGQALTGELSTSLQRKLTRKQNVHFWKWATTAHEVIAERAAVVLGDAIHHFHGERENRRYQARHDCMVEFDFDPDADVVVNADGLLEWSSDKPGLHRAVRDYFVGRREDD